MKNNQEFIKTSIEYFEDLEGIGALKTESWNKANDFIKTLNKVQESIEPKEKELLKKLEEIEELFWDFSKSTKKDYFKLGFKMRELIKESKKNEGEGVDE